MMTDFSPQMTLGSTLEPSARAPLNRRQAVRGIALAALAGGLAGPRPVSALQASAASPGAPKHPIFVLNSQDANVSVIDPVTWTERQRIPTGKEPHHLYLTPDEKSVIVANAASNSLTFIDPVTAQVQRTIPSIADPYHLRFSPDMKWFVTAANRLHHVDLYRWNPAAAEPLTLVKRIEAPKTPSHLFIDTRSTVAYCSLQDSDELLAIDLATQAVRWKIKIGKMPADVFLTRDDKHLLVGLTGDKFVEIYDVSGATPKLVKRLETGAGAHAFRSRGDGRHLFVSNRVANSISMIHLPDFTVAAQLPGPAGPDCMEMLSDNKTLLLSSRWAGRMTVIDIDTRQVVRQVKVGRSPHGIWTLDHARRD
jgi:YVTN family beta-propeller protein